jgi:hypothetical protein
MKTKSFSSEIDIGATDALSLRVSVAALVRVLFEHPDDRDLMLALERKATLLKEDGRQIVGVKAQPFGGALRIRAMEALQNLIEDFHFDSEESRSEQDFRLFIRPSDWETVREFCLGHLGQLHSSILESDPTRELTEEFADALGIRLKRDQYICQAVGTIVEDQPSATEFIHAVGYATARMYRIFEVHIQDLSLVDAIIKNSRSYSDQGLYELALADFRKDGPGRANTVLTLPFKEINAFYKAIPSEARNKPVSFQNHLLDETVTAILDDVAAPKYRREQT